MMSLGTCSHQAGQWQQADRTCSSEELLDEGWKIHCLQKPQHLPGEVPLLELHTVPKIHFGVLH